jgi:hypothetical protein
MGSPAIAAMAATPSIPSPSRRQRSRDELDQQRMTLVIARPASSLGAARERLSRLDVRIQIVDSVTRGVATFIAR